jgi:hypothetical protein
MRLRPWTHSFRTQSHRTHSLRTHSQRQTPDRPWDVTEHRAPYKEIALETDEGTRMNLDISPDGNEIVLDMLGNIYIMPAEGGEARPLRESIA